MMPRRRRVVRAKGAPPGALDWMIRAYLLVLRAVHAQLVTQYVQDAAAGPRVPAAALAMIDRATRTIQTSVDEDLKRIPRINMAKVAGGESLVQAFRKRNVGLIRTIGAEHLARVEAVVQGEGARHVKGLAGALQDALGVSESRARFWARDQTLKLHADVVETKHRSLGIVEYIWRTSEDGTVREDHDRLKGKRFKYAEPPIVDKRTGRRENPGKDFQCRCHADPVLPIEGVKRAIAPAPKRSVPKPKPKPKLKSPPETWYPAAPKAPPVAPPPVPAPKQIQVQPIPAALQVQVKKSAAWIPPAATITEAVSRLPARNVEALWQTARQPTDPVFMAKLRAGIQRIKEHSSETLEAIAAYTGTEYYQIRLVEREAAGRLLKDDYKYLERMTPAYKDHLLKRARVLEQTHRGLAGHDRPHAGHILYRGARLKDIELRELLEDDAIDFGGSGSTSFSFTTAAEDFGHILSTLREDWAVLFEITEHKSGLAINPISKNKGESEVFFGANARFRVLNVEQISGHNRAIMIQLEEL
jgi:SPP1 gp7 family putative phage head morphogenesis protein